MFIYLDESGDLGFDFESKSPTDFFVITLLVCRSLDTVKIFKKAISRTLKNKINRNAKKSIKNEMKGSETTIGAKKYFFNQLQSNQDWSIYCVILKKRMLLQKLNQPPVHKNIYNNLARRILERVNFNHSLTRTVHLVVDRSKNSNEILEFNRYVAGHLAGLLPPDTRLMINHQISTENAGIQAVDLFSWGIFKKYQSQDEGWYSYFAARVREELVV